MFNSNKIYLQWFGYLHYHSINLPYKSFNMPTIPSIMGLHLRYRLWIAEMNSDITILRIFDDYLEELSSKKGEPQVQKGIEGFQQQFINLRKENDELKHEMHLLKMKLAAYSKAGEAIDTNTYQADNHETLKSRYDDFRKVFDKMKIDFGNFEAKWLK